MIEFVFSKSMGFLSHFSLIILFHMVTYKTSMILICLIIGTYIKFWKYYEWNVYADRSNWRSVVSFYTLGEKIWVNLYICIEDFFHCWTGPFFTSILIERAFPEDSQDVQFGHNTVNNLITEILQLQKITLTAP